MKKLISILTAIILFCGSSVFAADTGYGGGATNGSEILSSAIKIRLVAWEMQAVSGYTSTGIVTSSYAGGGPTVDENNDCLVPLISLSALWGYSFTDENNTITLSHENRTIVVPYDGNTATIDGKTVDFPHEHIVPMYASWDSVNDNEIYFNYSYLPEIFGVEKAEWDKDNLILLITENEYTPISDSERSFRKSEVDDLTNNKPKAQESSTQNPEPETLPLTDNRSAYIGVPSQFTDITDTSSLLNTCVNELTDRGVISGYDDNTFRPYSPVTRAEAAAMLCRLMGFEMKGNSGFSDVANGEWYSGAVGAVAEIGIVNGYDDGTFRPENNITYHEMLKLAYCLLGQPNAFYESVVTYAAHDGLTNELSSFKDDDYITRGDVCILLSKLLDTYITTWETDDGISYYGDSEMSLADYLSGKSTVYHYFCSMKQYEAYGEAVKSNQ